MATTANETAGYDSGQAMPFVDSRLYSDEPLFEEELRRIWKKVWLPTVHESELAAPLDFRTLTVAREPVVIVRGGDGKVRAFRNVCPHRGNLIVRKPAGNLAEAEPSGNANHMTCMFHAWQFDSLGRCVDIPRLKQGYQDRLSKAQVSLGELRSEVAFGGFVWLSLDAAGPSLADYIGDAFGIMKEELDTEPLERLPLSQVLHQQQFQALARHQQRVLPRLHALL